MVQSADRGSVSARTVLVSAWSGMRELGSSRYRLRVAWFGH